MDGTWFLGGQGDRGTAPHWVRFGSRKPRPFYADFQFSQKYEAKSAVERRGQGDYDFQYFQVNFIVSLCNLLKGKAEPLR